MLKTVGNPSTRYGDQTIVDGGLIFATPGEGILYPDSVSGYALAPAFSAYQNSAQVIPATTDTKLLFQAEEFDTNSNFASSRFTPTVAGYYQLTGGVRYSSGAATTYLSFLKNGINSKRTSMPISSDQFYGSVLMYFNGTTDYVEMWVYALGAATCDATASSTYFQGALVRAA